MIVFEYMYDMMKVFKPCMNDWAEKELAASQENDGDDKVSLHYIIVIMCTLMCKIIILHLSTQDNIQAGKATMVPQARPLYQGSTQDQIKDLCMENNCLSIHNYDIDSILQI